MQNSSEQIRQHLLTDDLIDILRGETRTDSIENTDSNIIKTTTDKGISNKLDKQIFTVTIIYK